LIAAFKFRGHGRLTGVSDTSASITKDVPPSGSTYDALNRPITTSWTPTPTQMTPDL
jgi:hypothetical protein